MIKLAKISLTSVYNLGDPFYILPTIVYVPLQARYYILSEEKLIFLLGKKITFVIKQSKKIFDAHTGFKNILAKEINPFSKYSLSFMHSYPSAKIQRISIYARISRQWAHN